MPPKKKPAPATRAPATRRSKLTVEAILQSFAELCAQYGYDEVTMNLMAERAGVSVGAIYQYFPNKEAIAVALYEETSSRAALAVREAILQNIDESIAVTLPRALGQLLRAYQDNRAVLIDMPDSSPRLRKAVRHVGVEELINRSSRLYIEQHADELGARDLDLFRYFLYAVVKGCVREYVINPPEGVSEARFLAELASITTAYAQLAAPARTAPAKLRRGSASPAGGGASGDTRPPGRRSG